MTETLQQEVIQMKDKGMTLSAIAREVGHSKSVISRILQVYNDSDTNSFKSHLNCSSVQWWTRYGSVSLCLREVGESKFNLLGSDGKRFVQHQTKERLRKCIKKPVKCGGGSVMVWGMFSAARVGPFIQIHGRVNASIYQIQNLLRRYTVPSLQASPNQPAIFMQNNAPVTLQNSHSGSLKLRTLKRPKSWSKPINQFRISEKLAINLWLRKVWTKVTPVQSEKLCPVAADVLKSFKARACTLPTNLWQL